MWARLVLRNCLISRGRSAFTILTVAAALVINGLFMAYGRSIVSESLYLPGQPRLVIVAPKGDVAKTEGALSPSASVLAAERVVISDGFVGTTAVKLLRYSASSRLVAPALEPGSERPDGGAIVPRSLSDSAGLVAGSRFSPFEPSATGSTALDLTVSAISDDDLWPMILIPMAPTAFPKDAEVRFLVGLKPGTSVIDWTARFARQTGAAVSPLESMQSSSVAAKSTTEQLEANLVTLILVIAGLGIANSVGLSMIEREGQSGLLRALGLPGWVVGAAYLAEALALTTAGIVIAFLASSAGSYLLPEQVAQALPGAVARGAGPALAVGTLSSLLLVAIWQGRTPRNLLRKRIT